MNRRLRSGPSAWKGGGGSLTAIGRAEAVYCADLDGLHDGDDVERLQRAVQTDLPPHGSAPPQAIGNAAIQRTPAPRWW